MFSLIKRKFFYNKNKKRSPAVIGNPDAARQAIMFSSRRSSFERASFGKYDIPFWKRKLFRVAVGLVLLGVLLWLFWESILGVELFN